MSDLEILRALLSYARRNGWDHGTFGAPKDQEHVWRLGDRCVSLWGDELELQRPGARRSLWCPVDIAEVARVLVAAEFLPADEVKA